ncbi:MAG: V-type ATPase subunit [Eubacteriales bacterium]|nr:V-type ATPase subunit [Eubacteriales bacterium]
MSLFRYSGLTTKVRAMSGKLLDREDFDQLCSLGSVPEVVGWLKKKPSYAKVFANENENSMHRGRAEGLMRRSVYSDFSRLYRFSNLEQRKFLDTYFRRYETICLKNIIRAVMSGTTADVSDFEEAFSRHSAFPLQQAAAADSMESLTAILAKTPYGAVLRAVAASGSSTLFDYEFALDMMYFKDLWKRVRKELKKEDREAVIQSVGTQIDTLNLQWIYRAKRYYRMDAASVYALIIPVHYRLTLEQVKRMAEAESTEDMIACARATKYGKYLQEAGIPDLEQAGDVIQETVHRALMGQNPYSAACLEVYLYRKEREVHRVITAMEGVRYGLPADKIKEYLA